MGQETTTLRWWATSPVLFVALGATALNPLPAFARCTTSGSTTTCTPASPNPWTSTVGSGRSDHDWTVEVNSNSTLEATNDPAISLGDTASITLRTGSTVRGIDNSGEGNFGTGPNLIEFNSNGTLVVQSGALVTKTGSADRAEGVNVHGFGNRIENRGTIEATGSAALWFEDQNIPAGAAKNVVDNYGVIRRGGGGPVMGTSGGAGIQFYNQTGARVEGALSFAQGDDDLFFYADSLVAGSINGGGGTDNLTLHGALGSSDVLGGNIAGFETLTKDGLGRWTVTGSLTGFSATNVTLGTLALTGNNSGYTAGVTVGPLGTLEARAQSLPTQADPANNLGNIRNSGVLRFTQSDNGSYAGQIVGTGRVEKVGAGVLTLAPSAADNTYSGGTDLVEGTIAVSSDGALGVPDGELRFNGGTLRSTASFSTARPITLHAAGGTIETATGTLTQRGNVIKGAGALAKTGPGTLVLGAGNTYSGGTRLNGGVLEAAADSGLGAAAGPLSFSSGTLRTTASFTTSRATTLQSGGGTFETQSGMLTHTGAVAGAGQLAKSGPGTLVLDGTNTYSGGTRIAAGVLEVERDANLGAAAGLLSFDTATLRTTASMSMDRDTTLLAAGGTFETAAGTLRQAGDISGSGGLGKARSGTMILTGTGTYTGGTTVSGGSLVLGDGGTTGSIVGSVQNDGALSFDRSDAADFVGTISGSGVVTQTGTGTTRLLGDNAYLGLTRVARGALYINGDQSGATGATGADSGTTLGGSGVIGGDVTVASGATLAPGDVGATPGTLRINGALGLGAGAILDYRFGQANVPGGALNDLTDVRGDLTLDGILNVSVSPGGAFAPGVYRVFNYGGSLTDDGLVIGSIPTPAFYVQTSVARQVNLVNTTGLTLNFWDGAAGPKNDGAVNGGGGTWQSSAGNDAWTEATGLVNAPFSDGAFAIFTGAPGTVTVDAGLGAVTVSGMQFAVDGYRVEGDPVALVGAPASTVRVGDGTAVGAEMTATITSELTGASLLRKTDLGTLILESANTYDGGTAIDGGVLQIADDASLGSAAGTLSFDAGTLRTMANVATSRTTTLEAGGGTLEIAAGTLSHNGAIGGAGGLTKTGSGALVLDGANTYGGGTSIKSGIIEVGSDANLGAAGGTLSFDAGTLRTTADIDMTRRTTLAAGGGTIEVASGAALRQAGTIAGPGELTKSGAGTMVMAGEGTYSGGTTIADGTLSLGDGGTTGSILGSVRNNGALVFNRADAVDFAGPISGSGLVQQSGLGTTRLLGANNYLGLTRVTQGALYINGDQAAATGPTTADTGTTLGGAGVIGGDVAVAGGATLAPGDVGSIPGKLRINGDLRLGLDAVLDYSFGQANVPGGALNDLTEVGGDLTLDGTLNVSQPPGGSFDPGIYRVISYLGSLTDDGLEIGTIQSTSFSVQTSIAQQVNLINSAGLTLNFWDGDASPKNNGVPDGGDGTWQSTAGNDNWTEQTGTINAPFTDGAFAVFPGTSGLLTVDPSLGPVAVSGMQFAADGYRVEGGSIDLVGAPDASIRVGDGSDAGAGFTATIASDLTGASLLRKTDSGTLVLEGINSYAGGTSIGGGVLQVASDSNLGAVSSALSLGGGVLRTTASFAMDRDTTLEGAGGTFEALAGATLRQAGDIGGIGPLTKAGAGTLELTGAATHDGGTIIAAGTLRIGDGGTSGSIDGDIANGGLLVFDRSSRLDYDGVVSGTGALRQVGKGATVLGGRNTYSGPTAVANGILRAGAAGTFSPASAHAVATGAALDLAGLDQKVARLSNAGRVSFGERPGTRLTVDGDYVGQGGVLHFTAELGGDSSPSDLMAVEGNTSGMTAIELDNAGGGGAETGEGIKIIDVEGTSAGQFSLLGDFVIGDRPAVIAGAYGYTLSKGGTADPTDGDWYLRSELAGTEAPPGPGPGPAPGPILQPGAPIYQAYPAALLALNGLPTMQERLGNRYWSGAGHPPAPGGAGAAGSELPSGGLVDDKRAWARIQASRSNLQPDVEIGPAPGYDLDIWRLQVGMDRPVPVTDDGVLIAGVSFSYGSVNTDVSSFYGDGEIDTDGYGLGGSLTWLRGDDAYVDGQAQLIWFDSDLSSRDLGEDLASGNSGFGYAFGIEAGKRIGLSEEWTITPQAQVAYSSVDFDEFTDPSGARVGPDEGTAMPARLGVALDQERASLDDRRGKTRTHIYGIANLYYDLIGETEVEVAGTSLSSDGEQIWGSLGVGGTYSWSDGAYGVYGQGLVSSSLSSFGDNYTNAATFGFRMAW